VPVSVLLLLVVALILCSLAISDLQSRHLPNHRVFALGLLYLLYGLWAIPSTGWGAIGWHVVAGLLAFVVLFVLYVLGAMGGGDVKLGAAVYLWAGPAGAFPVTIIITWLGALLAVMGWLVDRPGLQRFTNRPWRCISNAVSAQRGVPYGLALAAGGLYVLWRHALLL